MTPAEFADERCALGIPNPGDLLHLEKSRSLRK